MNLVCPHCRAAGDYRPAEIHVFVRCHRCSREFRPAEAPPQIGNRKAGGERAQERGAFGRNPLAPEEASAEWLGHTQRAARLYRSGHYADAEHELRLSLTLNPDQPRAKSLLRRIHALRSAQR